jgi:hypothetical protein
MAAASPMRASARMSPSVPRKYAIAEVQTASKLPTRCQERVPRSFVRRIGCRICNTNGKAQCGDTGSIRFRERIR